MWLRSDPALLNKLRPVFQTHGSADEPVLSSPLIMGQLIIITRGPGACPGTRRVWPDCSHCRTSRIWHGLIYTPTHNVSPRRSTKHAGIFLQSVGWLAGTSGKPKLSPLPHHTSVPRYGGFRDTLSPCSAAEACCSKMRHWNVNTR